MNWLAIVIEGGLLLAVVFLIVSWVIIRKEEKHGSDD